MTPSNIAFPGDPSPRRNGRQSTRGALRPDAFLQSLEKGLDVLESFQFTKPVQTIAEVAACTGHDRATTRRALLTLVQKGYLAQNGKHFSLTAKVLGFGYQYLAALPFWAQAHPVLEELSDELNETISIGVLDGWDVVFILRVPAKRLLTFDPSTGSRVPAHVHSIGHVLLASLQAAELDAFLGQLELTSFTPNTIRNRRELRAHLLQAGQQQWAFANSQHELNLGGVSVPIKNHHGKTLAALNVNFIMDADAERRARGHMLPRLQLAARRIQQSMRL
ncbi:MAG: IclR family transcriptional regulator C-terminal domain-containing protein [Ottowia sp.]|uniref:IclR family transcriptional regulator domain-containing protein n=1 Tax=Ottowia sp. TaxID=1898956 RepID=UPI003C707232